MSSLRVSNFRYIYPNRDEEVLRDLSFAIESPHMFSVIGGNLAGKTTLAHIIIRKHLQQLEGTVSGTIDLDFATSRNDFIGLLFEDVHWMFCNLHVEDEVAFGLENLCVPPDEIRRRVDEVLEIIGLPGFQRRQINTLSGGETQKLALAAVLVTEPQFLITDDLLSNLDVISSAELPTLLDQYQRRSSCVWMDLSRRWTDQGSAGDRIAILQDGTLLGTGPPAEIFERFGTQLITNGNIELPEILEILWTANRALERRNLPKIPFTFEHKRLLESIAQRFRPRPDTRKGGGAGNNGAGLEIDNVHFRYGRNAPVLTDCSLSVMPHRINILAGRNGSGKSTLAKICAGLLKPNRGRIFWRGSLLTQRLLREKVCLIFQDPEYHFLTDTVSDEIELTGRLLALPHDENSKQVAKILSLLGLESKAGLSPFALTSGEKRRLAIGIALVRKADILIVDEPTLGQDKRQTNLIGALFKRLASEGTTLIVVSHDSRFIFEYGEEMHFLSGGRVMFSGATPNFFASQSPSDFSGQSDVLAIWERMGDRNHDIEQSPRSIQGLFQSVEAIPDGYSRNVG